jgi:DNA-directed RNA polymerase specialized sigma24 family protein
MPSATEESAASLAPLCEAIARLSDEQAEVLLLAELDALPGVHA